MKLISLFRDILKLVSNISTAHHQNKLVTLIEVRFKGGLQRDHRNLAPLDEIHPEYSLF